MDQIYGACWLFSKVSYYRKMFAFLLLSIILSLLAVPCFLLRRSRDYRNALPSAFCYEIISYVIGLKYKIRGLENLNRNGGVLVINHQSALDLSVTAVLWPFVGKATVVIKKQILYYFPTPYLWGTLYIDRSNPAAAIVALNEQSKAITVDGAKLIIFPEGTRGNGKKLLPFKKGAFHIAIQSQSFIQPVVVSQYTFLDSQKKRFDRGHSYISILPEINCKGLTINDIPMLMEKTHAIMQKHYEELNEDAKKNLH